MLITSTQKACSLLQIMDAELGSHEAVPAGMVPLLVDPGFDAMLQPDMLAPTYVRSTSATAPATHGSGTMCMPTHQSVSCITNWQPRAADHLDWMFSELSDTRPLTAPQKPKPDAQDNLHTGHISKHDLRQMRNRSAAAQPALVP